MPFQSIQRIIPTITYIKKKDCTRDYFNKKDGNLVPFCNWVDQVSRWKKKKFPIYNQINTGVDLVVKFCSIVMLQAKSVPMSTRLTDIIIPSKSGRDQEDVTVLTSRMVIINACHMCSNRKRSLRLDNKLKWSVNKDCVVLCIPFTRILIERSQPDKWNLIQSSEWWHVSPFVHECWFRSQNTVNDRCIIN